MFSTISDFFGGGKSSTRTRRVRPSFAAKTTAKNNKSSWTVVEYSYMYEYIHEPSGPFVTKAAIHSFTSVWKKIRLEIRFADKSAKIANVYSKDHFMLFEGKKQSSGPLDILKTTLRSKSYPTKFKMKKTLQSIGQLFDFGRLHEFIDEKHFFKLSQSKPQSKPIDESLTAERQNQYRSQLEKIIKRVVAEKLM
jgi:hypothetical protein